MTKCSRKSPSTASASPHEVVRDEAQQALVARRGLGDDEVLPEVAVDGQRVAPAPRAPAPPRHVEVGVAQVVHPAARPPAPPRRAELHAVAHAREPVAQGLGARDGRAPRDAALARAQARLADRVQRGRVPPAHPALELALVGGAPGGTRPPRGRPGAAAGAPTRPGRARTATPPAAGPTRRAPCRTPPRPSA